MLDRPVDGLTGRELGPLRRHRQRSADRYLGCRSVWGRQKRCNVDHASEQPADRCLPFEPIRFLHWRELDWSREHFPQQPASVVNVLREQRSPVGDVLAYLRFDRLAIDAANVEPSGHGDRRIELVSAGLT